MLKGIYHSCQISHDTIRVDMRATSKTPQQITNFKLAVSAAKYMTADLGAATGSSLAPFGQNDIRQVDNG